MTTTQTTMWRGAPVPAPGDTITVTEITACYPLLPKWETDTSTGRVLWTTVEQTTDGIELAIQYDDGRHASITDNGWGGASRHLEQWRPATDDEVAGLEERPQSPAKQAGPDLPSTRPSLFDVLSQDQRWWPASGQSIALTDMGPRHRRNTLALLQRKAEQAFLTYSMSPMFIDAPDDVEADLLATDPADWMNQQPLLRRLAELVAADQAANVPDEPDARIGQPLPCEGVCGWCAAEGPVTVPGAPLPCRSCEQCSAPDYGQLQEVS